MPLHPSSHFSFLLKKTQICFWNSRFICNFKDFVRMEVSCFLQARSGLFHPVYVFWDSVMSLWISIAHSCLLQRVMKIPQFAYPFPPILDILTVSKSWLSLIICYSNSWTNLFLWKSDFFLLKKCGIKSKHLKKVKMNKLKYRKTDRKRHTRQIVKNKKLCVAN